MATELKKLQQEGEEAKAEGDADNGLPPSPPPSSAASPSNGFSFTISLQPTLTSVPNRSSTGCRKSFPAAVLNLPSAGDILSHSHLPLRPPPQAGAAVDRPLDHARSGRNHHHHEQAGENKEIGIKHKTLSFFFGHRKSRKECCHCGKEEEEEERKKKKKRKKKQKKLGFDMSGWVAKTYTSVIEVIFGDERHGGRLRRRDGWWKRKGQLSAPASMRASPSNSGRLSATWLTTLAAPPADGAGAGELGIQAAIAHCKSSNTRKTTDKCNCCDHKK